MSVRDLVALVDADTTTGALDVVLAVVERHQEAVAAVRAIDTATHRWVRQGSGMESKQHRDRWDAALKERDDAAEYLRLIVESYKR